MNIALITDFIASQVASFTKIDLRDFVLELRNRFYPDVAIDFMDYFLDLADQENDGKFIVPHSKMIEHGIATSGRSSAIKDRLDALGFVEGEHYNLQDVLQVRKTGNVIKHVYYLTPDAFFLALQRAQRRPNQTVDPTIYAKYFQFLQKVVKYYMIYQRDLEHALSLAKDAKLDAAVKRIDDQNTKIDDLQTTVKELLGYAKDTKLSLDDANDKIDDLKIDNKQLIKEVVETKEIVKDIDEMLTVKSFVSTRNPVHEGYVHHALVMYKRQGNGYVITIRSGQSAYIDNCKRELLADGFEVLYDKFYQANGIDYRRNVQNAIIEEIESALEELNSPIMELREQLKEEIDDFNAKLPQVIDEYNSQLALKVSEHNKSATKRDMIKLSSNGKRYYWRGVTTYAKIRFYDDEERSFEKEVRAKKYALLTLPIKVCATYISWKPNSYVSYDRLKAIIEKINVETQQSPRSSLSE